MAAFAPVPPRPSLTMAPEEWKSHGQKVPDSKCVWIAFLGPDTPALGEQPKIEGVAQSQVVTTLAALVGEDYAGALPKAGKPLARAVRRDRRNRSGGCSRESE